MSEQQDPNSTDRLCIGDVLLRSRLVVGTGKYRDFEQTKAAIEASGADMVTVAVRRIDTATPGGDATLQWLTERGTTLLPNTAGCYTAEDAVGTADGAVDEESTDADDGEDNDVEDVEEGAQVDEVDGADKGTSEGESAPPERAVEPQ